MRGGEWIVPVVVLIVWLISTIMKSREEEPVRPRKPGTEPGRKPTGDIDKFLQEIDRLRRKSAEEQGRTARPVPPPPRVKPSPPVVTRAKPVPRLEPAIPGPVVVEAVSASPVANLPRPGRATVDRPPTGATATMHLLRSPRSVAAAVVLQEVLGPPKCKRS
jgi:hypothetical protein